MWQGNRWMAAVLGVLVFAGWVSCSESGGEPSPPGTTTSGSSSSGGGGSSSTPSAGGGALDYLEVHLDGDVVYRVQADDPRCGAQAYAEQQVDISDYANGLPHELEFYAETFVTYGGYSSFFVDSVSLMACGGTGGAGGSGSCEQIDDGSFESGTPNNYWQEASTHYDTPLCDQTCTNEAANYADEGHWWAWFGGTDEPEQASLSQHITIPTDATTLTFQLRLRRCDGAP